MFIEQKYNKKNKEEKKNYLNKIFSWFLEDHNKIEAEKNIKLLDMFPNTEHVESFCILERK